MAINIDLSETENPESAGSFRRVAPGAAHLQVLDVKENGGKNGEHVIKVQVLMHSQQSEVGATHTEFFPATANMAWKVLAFAYATKVADRERMKAAKAAGGNYAPIDLTAAIGRQFFAVFKLTDRDRKQFVNLDSPLAIDDPSTASFPRNQGMLAQAMGRQPATQPALAPAADPFAALT